MLKLTFVVKKIDENSLALKLHWGFRVVFGALVAIIISSLAVTASEEDGGLLAVIMIIVFTLITLYNESWYFDRGNSKIIHLHGLIALAARSTFPLAEIESVEVKSFRKGSISAQKDEKRRFFQRDLLTLSLNFSGGDTKDIEIVEAKNKAALQRKAAAISDFLNINYHSEV